MPARGLNGKGVVGVSENIENTAVAGEQVESSEVEEQGFRLRRLRMSLTGSFRSAWRALRPGTRVSGT